MTRLQTFPSGGGNSSNKTRKTSVESNHTLIYKTHRICRVRLKILPTFGMKCFQQNVAIFSTRGWVVLIVGLAMCSTRLEAQMRVYSEEDDEGVNITRNGLEFGVNVGVYRGFSSAAYFYDGTGDKELSDAGAQIWSIQDRLDQLQNQQPQHPVSGILNEFPAPSIYSFPLMQYRPSLFFGLKAAKFWNPETAVVCHFDVAQATAEGTWSLSTGLLPDQGQGTKMCFSTPS